MCIHHLQTDVSDYIAQQSIKTINVAFFCSMVNRSLAYTSQQKYKMHEYLPKMNNNIRTHSQHYIFIITIKTSNISAWLIATNYPRFKNVELTTQITQICDLNKDLLINMYNILH